MSTRLFEDFCCPRWISRKIRVAKKFQNLNEAFTSFLTYLFQFQDVGTAKDMYSTTRGTLFIFKRARLWENIYEYTGDPYLFSRKPIGKLHILVLMNLLVTPTYFQESQLENYFFYNFSSKYTDFYRHTTSRRNNW